MPGSLRLIADMFPLSRQVQVASDTAKGAVARLAGIEIPKFEDNERTIAELKARIAKTLDFIESVPAAKIDGSEEREVVLQMRSGDMKFKGLTYLLGHACPNFYFHLTTAYNILRANGGLVRLDQFAKGAIVGRGLARGNHRRRVYAGRR